MILHHACRFCYCKHTTIKAVQCGVLQQLPELWQSELGLSNVIFEPVSCYTLKLHSRSTSMHQAVLGSAHIRRLFESGLPDCTGSGLQQTLPPS